jgi:hypothetical protein
MPVRVALPIQRRYWGWIERLYVHCSVSQIRELEGKGLSLFEIAHELRKRHGAFWDVDKVLHVVRLEAAIRQFDRAST